MNKINKSINQYDIVLITGEYYEDHPFSPSGVIVKVLQAKGYTVAIIEKPVSKQDFTKFGEPKLCFCVTSGSIDSMLHNYTPLKKKRIADEHSYVTEMPDRAVIAYCNKIKEYFKGTTAKIVIGGIEASLRRFGHYDYWDNKIRKSILFDTRADILVYGSGEKQIIEIASRLSAGKDLIGVEGTCIKSKELPSEFIKLPSYKEIHDDKVAFCKQQVLFSVEKNLAQEYDNNYILQYKFPRYTPADLDWIYGLSYSRNLRKNSLLKMAQFSVVTHRGCIGNCNFCSITLHQGANIVSRTEESILAEISSLTKHPDFKGHIDDLGGPSANMYGMDCATRCGKNCLGCNVLNKTHSRLIGLLRKARAIPRVKKIFIRSGIRYDLAINSDEYIREVSEHHISGSLKIAPEHFAPNVLKLMNKYDNTFDIFQQKFDAINKPKRQELKYYLMICHPGETEAELEKLLTKSRKLRNIEAFQLFTPTPMTVSTCMYWTGLNPYTLEKVPVVYDYSAKKIMKRKMLALVQAQENLRSRFDS